MATHSGILAWRIHEQRSLAGYSPWGQKESAMTEHLIHTHTHTEVGLYSPTEGQLWGKHHSQQERGE